MKYELTTSHIARSNVLNNPYAISEAQKHLQLGGLMFEGETVFTKAQVAEILEIDERTVDRYIASHSDELGKNGYRVLRGKALQDLRSSHVDDMNVVDIPKKAPSLGIFSFRAVLNFAMLVTESERAKQIRFKILDIVIDVIAQKSGGQTKYINQRDDGYLLTAYSEDSYRRQFTDALKLYLDMGRHKYMVYTNKIYQAVFCENAQEYKQVLKLADKEKTRDTMYAEVLQVIGSFESGLAVQMKEQSEKLGRLLKPHELDNLIQQAADSPFMKPYILDARIKMASRDLGFREALHEKLEHYIQAIPENDFDRFLGEKSRSLQEQLEDTATLDVLKRLKDR